MLATGKNHSHTVKGKNGGGYEGDCSPRMMSYRSITAATPTSFAPSSECRSTRITRPWALTNTSVPRVISDGRVRVRSSSVPASTSWSRVKYTPRVEISRVRPFLADACRSMGTRMMIGRDRSYRRAARLSVMSPPTQGKSAHSRPSLTPAISIPNGKLYQPNRDSRPHRGTAKQHTGLPQGLTKAISTRCAGLGHDPERFGRRRIAPKGSP